MHLRYLVVGCVLSLATIHCTTERPQAGSVANNQKKQSKVNRAPQPTANAIVVSAGQTGTTKVNPNDPDVGDTHSFSIVQVPTNGSASVSDAGEVTYTPNNGFVGTDLVRVKVTDQGGLSGEVVIDVTVQSLQPGNRAPAPTANAIVVVIGEVAQTQVNPNDPDGGDTHAYTIVQPPSRGAAVISNTGRVTYTAGDAVGQDSLRVRVTDSGGLSGEVTIAVSIDAAPYNQFGELPPAVCGDGYTRIKLAQVTPEPGTMLLSGVPVTFNVVVSYSVPVTTVIGLNPPVTSAAIPPGCGTLGISGVVTPPANPSFTLMLLVDSDSDNIADTPTSDGSLYYPVDATNAIARLRFEKIAFPPRGVLNTPIVEVGAWLSADLWGDWAIDYDNYIEVKSLGASSGFYNPYMYAVVAPLNGTPMRLRTLLGCGETEAVWLLYGNGVTVDSSETRLVLPAVPPAITVSQFTTRYPVNGNDVSQSIVVTSCVGNIDVTVSSNVPRLFDVQPTQTTLTNFGETLDITWLGGQLDAGSQVEGELVIRADDGSFTVRIPVSARGFNYPLYNPDYPGGFTAPPAGYFVRLPVVNYTNGADDAHDLVKLSFAVPDGFGGGTTNVVSVTANGVLFIGNYTGWDYNIPNGDFAAIDPGYFGYPMFSFVGGDNGFFDAERSGDFEHEAAVYFREVTDITGHHAEFLWWDLDSYEDSRTHNVFLVRLYPDGTVWVKFDQLDANGFEQFGSWAADGTLIDYIPIWQIQEGVWYQMGPIP